MGRIAIRLYDHLRDARKFAALNYQTFRDSIPEDEPISEAEFKRHHAWLLQHERELARGGTVDPTSGLGAEAAASAAIQSSNVNVYTMRLNGRVIGEWVNHPIVPGLTFGWGPTGTPLIAFADPSGKLTIMDREGKTQTIDGTKDVTLPAFAPDGSRLAFLQKTGRSSYALVIAVVKKK